MSSATTYKPTAGDVKRLREDTGAGMIDCRNALVTAEGDYDKAKTHLQETGQAKAAKKSERAAKEGLVGSYIHAGGKIGVLVEINCETDFVARNDKFQELVRDVAMHIAAMSPKYLDRDAVPAEIVASVREELAASVPPKAPPDKIEQIIAGKLNKWYEDQTLVDQHFVKDDSMTVGELVAGVSAVLGERIRINRFVKFALGETIEATEGGEG
ncbi:MAG: translation elongation factor Ts [Candidatus Velthaea sp.]